MQIPWRNSRRFLGKIFNQPVYAGKVAAKRSKAYYAYYAGNGEAGLPEAVTLFLTHRCNLRCRMCGQWGDQGVTRNKPAGDRTADMPVEDMKKIIDDIASFRPNITLFGGEPLLHRHAHELIGYIKKKELHCLMITNGSMLSRYGHGLVESGLDELNVSVDGGMELHDEIRGVPGLYSRIMDGLKEVTDLKEKMKTKTPLINLQCTINRHNYRHLEQMVTVAEEIRANSLTFHNLIFLDRDTMEKQLEFDRMLDCSSLNWEGFVCEPQVDPEALHAKIKDISRSKPDFPIDMYPNFSKEQLNDYYLNPSYAPSNGQGRCVSPWMTGYIFPDGELRPCLNFDYSFGNVRAESFAEVWNSEKAVRFRSTVRENRMLPACVRCTELYRY
ncbi:MAG: radical SAM protein [Nitrospiraceae bacterium]|nr:MAG: radical SAM protein [Nitrospiraceae bacterium]